MNRILACCCLVVPSSLALAADEGVQISGWFDTYYQLNFNRPAVGNLLAGRAFDVYGDQFSVGGALVSFKLAPTKKNRYGFTADLSFGKFADINAGLDGANGDSSKHFQQAFGTYVANDGTTFDFGKFNSWIGYEALYSADNSNYSIGTLFNYAQPNWHVGARMTKPLSDTSTLGLYLVNGWNETQDTNKGKTLGASLQKSWSSKLTTTFNYIGGNEGQNGIALPGTGTSNVQMLDLVAVYKTSDKHTLAFNGDYASSKSVGAGGNSGNWSGYSFYSNHKLSDSRDFSLRYSIFHDTDGLRGIGGSIGSLTGTYNIRTGSSSLLRLEVRNDFANQNVFAKSAGLSDKRTTFTIAHTIRF
jgi:hypothetical protein